MAKFVSRTIAQITLTRKLFIPARTYAHHMTMSWPMNSERALFMMVDREVAAGYNEVISGVVGSQANYVLTLEDDIITTATTVTDLMDRLEDSPDDTAAVAALYVTKHLSYPLVLGDPECPDDFQPRRHFPDNAMVAVNAVPMGATLWRTQVFRDLAAPWFQTTHKETQDVYFCRRAAQRGWKFFVDTGNRVGHLDVATDTVFEAKR